MKKNEEYTANSISLLSDLQHVRERTTMYVGDVGDLGHYTLFAEIFHNSVDEILEGHGSDIKVTMIDDKSIRIDDSGRGIPLEPNKDTKLSTLTTVYGYARSGGKFKNNTNYSHSLGLHGLGGFIVGALSDSFEATSYRGMKKGQVKFIKGILQGKDATISKNDTKIKHGTSVSFSPDYSIFKDVAGFNKDQIFSKIEDTAYLLPDANFIFQFGNDGCPQIVGDKSGLKGLLAKYAKSSLSMSFVDSIDFSISENSAPAKLEIAFGWKEKSDDPPIINGYVNLSHSSDGGTHIVGFEKAITNFIIERSKNKCSAKEVLEGLVCVLSLKHPCPQFSSQTKEKLINKELSKQVQDALEPVLKKWARKNATELDAFIAGMIERYEIRQSQKDFNKALKGLKKVGRSSRGILPSKLYEAECSSSVRELFVCEGDSAAGGLVIKRLPNQEVLPIRGKIINTLKTDVSTALLNKEISSIITAVGGGFGDKFDISKIRINKLLLLCDSDDDGKHISSLLITFIHQYMPALIQNGHVYIVDAPLFQGTNKSNNKKYFGHTLEDIKNISGKDYSKCVITRLKGLGESEPQDLFLYACDPSTRKLIQVCLETNTKQAIEEIMGEDTSFRKKLLGV